MSFRREKYVPKGGPDGGDGAAGGDVVLGGHASGAPTSTTFASKHHFRAANGGHGKGDLRRGADGQAAGAGRCRWAPRSATPAGELLARPCRGGPAPCSWRAAARAGAATSASRPPRARRRASPSTGCPARSSGCTSRSSCSPTSASWVCPTPASPRCWPRSPGRGRRSPPYPFTTLEPNLGVLEVDGRAVVLADIPGLMEGASRGVGLGDRFLAHVERTRMLVFVVDGGQGDEAVAAGSGDRARASCSPSSPRWPGRPPIVAVNKVDLVSAGDVADVLRVAAPALCVTGAAGGGVGDRSRGSGGPRRCSRHRRSPMRRRLRHSLETQRRPGRCSDRRPTVWRASASSQEGDAFRVTGGSPRASGRQGRPGQREAVEYVQTVMEKAGVSTALRKSGAQPGDRC